MCNLEENCYTKKYTFSTVVKVSPSLDLFVSAVPEDSGYFCSQKNWKQFAEEDLNDTDPDMNLTFSAKGGMLADEMGLGKTLTVISMIASNPRKLDPKTNSYLPASGVVVPDKKYIKTTLVVCPSQLVAQWGSEIGKHSNLTYKCCTRYTDYRNPDVSDYDVLIVSHNAFFNRKNRQETCDESFLKYGW